MKAFCSQREVCLQLLKSSEYDVFCEALPKAPLEFTGLNNFMPKNLRIFIYDFCIQYTALH